MYNRKKGINSEVAGYGDTVTIVSQIGDNSQSWFEASLTESTGVHRVSSWEDTGKALVIQVCERVNGLIDYARVLVYLEDGVNDLSCDMPTSSPTQSRTKAPSRKPSQSPSKNPSRNPTKSPTPPTVSPTQSPTQPTGAPSDIPTQPTGSPSKAHTKNPSLSPSNAPSNSPTTFPTDSPVYPNEFTVIDYEDFENGWGDYWNPTVWESSKKSKKGSFKTGEESKIDDKYVDALNSTLAKTNAVVLKKSKKSKSTESSFYTNVIDVGSFITVKVDFYVRSKKLKGDGFYLEAATITTPIDDDPSTSIYYVVKHFQDGVDFWNDEFWSQQIIEFDVSTVQDVRVRFRCNATYDKAEVRIDHVTLSGRAGAF
jgi:hypothetical protein